MAIANTAIYGNHFDDDISGIFFDGYIEAEKEFSKIAKVASAPAGHHYTESELSPLGELRDIDEGDAIQFDIPIEGHKKTIYYQKSGLGFQITKENVVDDLFGNFKQVPAKLGKSAAYKCEVEFFGLFNTAFVNTYHTAWDALPICDAAHTTLKSLEAQPNEPAVAGALSETTLQAAFEYYDTLVDEAGMPISMNGPFKLVTSVDNRWITSQLMRNEFNLGSGNRDFLTTNPENNMIEPWVIHLTRHMVDSDRWFLIAADHDMRFWWKEEYGLESMDDFYTGNALFKTVGRFAPFVMDYHGIYGNPGA